MKEYLLVSDVMMSEEEDAINNNSLCKASLAVATMYHTEISPIQVITLLLSLVQQSIITKQQWNVFFFNIRHFSAAFGWHWMYHVSSSHANYDAIQVTLRYCKIMCSCHTQHCLTQLLCNNKMSRPNLCLSVNLVFNFFSKTTYQFIFKFHV